MKKAITTLIQPRGWMSIIGRSVFLVLFAWCFTGFTDLSAQAKMPANGTPAMHKLNTCGVDSLQFTDDNLVDGVLYSDHKTGATTTPRADTIEFCAQNAWHAVSIVFTEYDLAIGDTLFVYQGNLAEVKAGMAAASFSTSGSYGPVGGTVVTTSSGVSSAFGGWVQSSCDPNENTSGCLTFIFKTNKDNNKGTGWDAWVKCQKRDITLSATVASAKMQCLDSMAWVGIPVPNITTSCGSHVSGGLVDSTVCIVVKRQDGAFCKLRAATMAGADPATCAGLPALMDTLCVDIATQRNPGKDGVMFTSDDILASLDLGPGSYSYEIYLDADHTKSTSGVFSVSLPSLVCNDEVNIPLSSGCGFEITLDDVLENPCEGNDHIVYDFKVTVGDSTINTQILTGSGSSIRGLWIDKGVLDAANMTCSGEVTVEVSRTFTPPNMSGQNTGSTGCPAVDLSQNGTKDAFTSFCNNGPVKTTCSTVVNFKDETAPIISNNGTPTITVDACATSSDAIVAVVKEQAKFIVLENCNIKDTTFAIDGSLSSDLCTASSSVNVKITVTDGCDKTGELTIPVTLNRPTTFIQPKDTIVDCGISTDPTSVGWPKLNVTGDNDPDITKDSYTCNYIATFTDQEFPSSCPQNKKILRTWSILDWCTQKYVSTTLTQTIQVKDTLRPVIVCVSDTDTGSSAKPHKFTTDHDKCGKVVSISTPSATDMCDPNPAVTVIDVLSTADSSKVADDLTGEIACGSYIARYHATDACGNVSMDTCYVFFDVEDKTTPTAICTDAINVSLGSNNAIISTASVNAGSTDNCTFTVDGIKIKGSSDDYGPSVTVTCDNKPGSEIELKVTDKAGNSNVCWSKLVIEDKVAPTSTAPPPGSGTCDQYHQNVFVEGTVTDPVLQALLNDNFGRFTYSDNCGDAVAPSESLSVTSEDCGSFVVTRTYTAKDWGGTPTSATQTITITGTPDWKLTFPADDKISCGDEFPDADSADDILTSLGFCDRLSVNVTGQRFTGGSDACVKMVRTYTVWNSCGEPGTVYNVNSENDGGLMVTHDSTNAERIVYVQTITAEITDGPTISTYLISSDSIVAGPDKAGNGDCSEMKEIEVWAKDCLDANVGEGNVTIKLTDAAGNTVDITEEYVEDGPESFWIVGANVGTGDYTMEVWATDGCGNSSGSIETFTFVDAKAPSIYVLNGIATHVMPTTGTIDIWADDFIEDVIDCDARGDLTIAIWHTSDGEAPDCGDRDALVDLGQSVDFDCDYIGTQLVRIYAMDVAGNCDYVETYIIIQDNGAACGNDTGGAIPTESQIAGKVINTSGDLIESVSVAVNGTMSDAMTTSASGTYVFTLDNGGDYTITPEKDINPLNGVSTFDLVLISKHILGVDPFDTPYKYIAADVNNNGTVTAFDIVLLRQLILNITSEFTNNTSWRFVDASYNFGSDVATTLAQNFPEIMNINNLEGDKLDNDFVAVKVGDINGSAVPNSLVSSEVRTAAGTLVVTTADRYVEAGETVQVAFTSADIAAVTGYQFTMNYAGLEFTELVEGVAKANNFNTNLRGAIATSWNGNATANEELFTVNFTATTSGALSELLSISSDITTAEAYSDAGEVLDIALEFTGDAAQSVFELTQNTPNPFNGETVIGFTLPQAGAATLKVMDVQGKVIKQITGDYTKGYNQISLNAKELGATGVLHYQLESAEHTATRKMIIIE